AVGTLPADGRLGRDARGYGPLRTRRRGPLHAPLGRPPRVSGEAGGTPASRQTRIRSQRRSSTCPGGAPRGLLTSATRQRWPPTLARHSTSVADGAPERRAGRLTLPVRGA